jgi:predicted RNA-binding Zn-ribbon protein involved in translation (DUF1610 family)
MDTSGRRFQIFESIGVGPLGDPYASGFIPGCGTYFCLSCGSQVALRETDPLPRCDECGEGRFRRDSIFSAHQDHQATAEHALPSRHEAPGWLQDARDRLERAGDHLVYQEEDGRIASFTIERGWTRIGRSEAADISLDHPTVSRRHALIVAQPGKGLRVLDDRSLNGVLVNGEPVEMKTLRDGDELAIGRFRLFLLRS